MRTDYTRHYLKWHNDSLEHQEAMIAFYRQILGPHLGQDRQANVIDVGCGMGFALLALRDIGFSNLLGVEADEGQARSCKAKNLRVELTEDTADWLRHRPAAFDLALALDVIEHIPVPKQMEFIRGIAESLRPGGKFICTVPNATSALASRWRYVDWTHQTSFTEHSLDFLLYNGGFREIQVLPAELLFRPRLFWLPFLGTARHWWAWRFFRLMRRLEMMAELGPDQGRAVPLSLNLLGIARKLHDS